VSPSTADPPGPDPRLRVDDRVALVTLEGELDLARADELAGLLALAIDAAPAGRVVVDMSAVEFIDSTIMQVLLRAHRQAEAAGVALLLRGLGGHPRTMLELAGLHLSLRIEPTA
jgi:anti-sigma B factor antagonist